MKFPSKSLRALSGDQGAQHTMPTHTTRKRTPEGEATGCPEKQGCAWFKIREKRPAEGKKPETVLGEHREAKTTRLSGRPDDWRMIYTLLALGIYLGGILEVERRGFLFKK